MQATHPTVRYEAEEVDVSVRQRSYHAQFECEPQSPDVG